MPNDGIPFYLKIDSVSVTGSTNRITDVWVEANADNIGAYELPCNFPVLQENQVRFVLLPGIMESGQSTVRVTYPFYESDTFTLTATRGETYSHVSVFKYRAGTQFALDESFEVGNGFNGLAKVDEASDTNVVYGNNCGRLLVTAVDSSEEAVQLDTMPLLLGGEAWLEVDYRCDVPFYVGIYGNYTTSARVRLPYIFLSAKAEWNKVYIKLNDAVSYLRADNYSIYFEALRPFGSNGGAVHIDNVRVVHF